MADVAAAAGVSAQTVSRVANGYAGVVESTRRKVVAAMDELGYRPNAAARALKRGTFRNIGVVMFDLTATGNTSTLAAVTESANAEGYTVTLMTSPGRTSASVSGAFSRLQEMAVDGVILIMEAAPDDDAFVIPPTAHLVVADSNQGDRYPVVDTDQAGGAHAAVEHLLSLGHTTVHHVTGPGRSYSARQREATWREVLTVHGRRVPDPVTGDWTAASGYEAGLRLADDPTCTAVFCANDEMALGLVRALGEKGLAVPQDVSVVGFDDIPLAETFIPPLTTVHQDFAGLGRACVTKLLTLIQMGDDEVGVDLVPTHLVVRGSTAPPPPSRPLPS